MKFSIDIKKGKLDKILNIKESDFPKVMDDHSKMHEFLKKAVEKNYFNKLDYLTYAKQLLKEIES